MTTRKIIKIDESRCNGCGECITACAEGAIELKDKKARVVSDSFCDGIGACLAVCPQGAITLEEREAPDYDEKAAKEHMIPAGKHPGEERITPCTMPIVLGQKQSQRPEAPS